ncbi:MAG TPA: thioredoxin domain-containing protein [Polyangiaceae bacterium]|nr:thioredoxin domain-containing protein [Polyangiaceae bacterium]
MTVSSRRLRSTWTAWVAAASTLVACGGGAGDPSSAKPDIDLPGVDTHEFTPREKHEFSSYVTELPAPCSSVAVPIAECITGNRPCSGCLPAAQVIAKAVREGMARDQIEHLYKEQFDSTSAVAIPVAGSPARGPEDAAVTVVEFADFECPFCQRIAPELDKLWEDRKTTLRFVYKFMPLAMHPHGEIAARAAIAAQAQGKFWEMHRLLFASGDKLDQASLEGYAASLGLDLDRFRADMQSAETKARIDADRKLGDALNVKGTPTIFINGHEYESKVDLAEWVDRAIASTKAH